MNLNNFGNGRHFFTVSELTRDIKNILEREFGVCWVVGEISNLKEPTSGHLYFVLKDEKAQLRAVCFKGSRSILRFSPVEGLEVLCFGRITVYEPRGEYQIIVEYMEPRGIGALRKLFEQLRKKLAEEGLFDQQRKKPLPICPQKILVITSSTGAAIRDILAILRRAPFPTEISIIPVKVQGDKAPEEIVKAIQMANELQPEKMWDLAIIGRGGGSIEDLWAFNEEKVVRALANMKIPTISAVGHEIDVTLTDFVADYRVPTPTAAAKWVVDRQEEVKRNLRDYETRLKLQVENLLLRTQQTLDLFREKLKSPDQVLKERIEKLRNWKERIIQTTKYHLNLMKSYLSLLHSRLISSKTIREIPLLRQRLEHQRSLILKELAETLRRYSDRHRKYLASLEALSPYKVLERGYAIVTRDSDGFLVKDPEDAPPGIILRIRLSKGEILCRSISSKENKDDR